MDDIFVFTSFTTSNCYIVTPDISDGISYVIDLPPDLDPVLDYIKQENLSVGGALLTHGHFDHSLGMSSFCLLYTSPSPRDPVSSRMPSSA